MNIKKNLKLLALSTAVMTTLSSALPVFAEEIVLPPGGSAVPISVDAPSTFEITVPKKITLIKGSKESIDVKIKGDISGTERLVLKTDDSITLSQVDKDDVVAETTLAKESFNWDDINGTGTTTQLHISPDGLSAGKWTGNCTVNVSLSKLPDGYTDLEWIASDGTQYINTDYILTRSADDQSSYEIACDFYFDNSLGLSYTSYKYAPYGFGRYEDKNVFGIAYEPRIPFIHIGTGESAQSTQGGSGRNNTKIIFDKDGVGNIYLNDTAVAQAPVTYGTKQKNCSYLITNNTLPLYLFTTSTENSSLFYPFHGRIYKFSVVIDGTPVVNMIPCLNNNGEAGMYDTVRKQFYGNSGAGDFVVPSN